MLRSQMAFEVHVQVHVQVQVQVQVLLLLLMLTLLFCLLFAVLDIAMDCKGWLQQRLRRRLAYQDVLPISQPACERRREQLGHLRQLLHHRLHVW